MKCKAESTFDDITLVFMCVLVVICIRSMLVICTNVHRVTLNAFDSKTFCS